MIDLNDGVQVVSGDQQENESYDSQWNKQVRFSLICFGDFASFDLDHVEIEVISDVFREIIDRLRLLQGDPKRSYLFLFL